MGQFFDEIPEFLISWINKQHMFWVATAPLGGEGHVNLSPKCTRGTFHIVDNRRVWYEDMSGSGVETISHIRENGRVTVLFHAFDGPPRIARLFGTGTVYEFGTPEYNDFISPEKRVPGSRAVIMIDVHKVGTSCGYAIPFYEFKSHRNQLLQWAQRHEAEDDTAQENNTKEMAKKGLKDYWTKHNMRSIDGIPGLATAPNVNGMFNTGHLKFESDNGKEKGSFGGKSSGSGGVVDGRFLMGMVMGVVGTVVCIKMATLV